MISGEVLVTALAGLVAGAVLTGLVLVSWFRARLARLRLESASHLSAVETTAESERVRRQDLEIELRSVQTERAELSTQLAVAEREVQTVQASIAEQREFLDSSRTELENAFRSLASTVLEGNTKRFLELAEERFARSTTVASGELEQRKQAIQSLLDPLNQTLHRLESRTGDIEKARVDAYRKIDEHVKALSEQTAHLQEKTTSLVAALKGSQVRGRWGEIALRNIAELSGMSEHCDFLEQKAVADGKRPDMLVHLPGGRQIAVDAKAPLTAYQAAMDAKSPRERDAALDRHVKGLRGHVRALAGRDYAAQTGEMDLVVMFLPGDTYLAAAFAREPELQVEAFRSNVLIATPTTLVALLRTVAIYWQQSTVAENAERIASTARELYERARVFSDHLEKMGRGLQGAVDAYNQAVGSFERRWVPMARRLEEMKVTEHTKRALDTPEKVDEVSRSVGPPAGAP